MSPDPLLWAQARWILGRDARSAASQATLQHSAGRQTQARRRARAAAKTMAKEDLRHGLHLPHHGLRAVKVDIEKEDRRDGVQAKVMVEAAREA